MYFTRNALNVDKVLNRSLPSIVMFLWFAYVGPVYSQFFLAVPDAGFEDHTLLEGDFVYVGVSTETSWNSARGTYTLTVWAGTAWGTSSGYDVGWRLYFTGEDYTNNLITETGNAPEGYYELVSVVYIADQLPFAKGYCIVYGCGEGRLAYEIAKRTDLKIIGFEEDANKVKVARNALDRDDNRSPRPAWPETTALYDIWHGHHGDYQSRVSFDLAFQVVVGSDSLYFGSSNADTVACLNTLTGKERWKFFTNGPVRFAPTLYEGKIYFGSDDGLAYCLNASDGSLIWSRKVTSDNRLLFGNSRTISTAPVRTSVLVENGIAYWAAGIFSQLGHYLCACDASTDAPVWTRTPSQPSRGYLLSAGDSLFVPSGKFKPATYNQSNGNGGNTLGLSGCYALVIGDADFANGPGYGGSRSYINDPGAAIARVDGNCLVVKDEYSYFCTDNEIVKLKRANGAIQWRVSSPYRYSLIMAGDTIFAGGDDEVAAFSTATGETLWTHPVNGRACGLAAASKQLFVSTDKGSIHAFGHHPADLVQDGAINLKDLWFFGLEWLECTNPNDSRCRVVAQ